jgi:hypothetical protein
MPDLKFEFLNWLFTFKSVQETPTSPKKKGKSIAPKASDLNSFLNEPGLRSFIRAYNRHLTEFTD